jgi:hypothetical protein
MLKRGNMPSLSHVASNQCEPREYQSAHLRFRWPKCVSCATSEKLYTRFNAVVSHSSRFATVNDSCSVDHTHLSHNPHHIRRLLQPARADKLDSPAKVGLEIVCDSLMRHQTHAQTGTSRPNEPQTCRWHNIRPRTMRLSPMTAAYHTCTLCAPRTPRTMRLSSSCLLITACAPEAALHAYCR